MIKDETDISPFGEWSWSMMGLAGRDPIFYAQLESEGALHSQPGGDFSEPAIQNLCLHCHGVMGQRQFTTDNPGELFTTQDALASGEGDPHKDYGGLARDGVSCMVCHQIADQTGLPITEIETGDFLLAPATNGIRSIFGPFQQPTTKPMLQALGLKPVVGAQISQSLLCASCHTVKLPVLDAQGKTVAEKYEQATYLEWQNSAFSRDTANLKSCQDCHLPKTFHDSEPLEFKIANVQDQDFPVADGVSPVNEITVEPRADYGRHALAGINVFGLTFFQQYPDILGVPVKSFMTGFDNGLNNSIQNSLDQAAQSGRIDILSSQASGTVVETKLRVRNVVGHRFPSGVGFRRLFLQVPSMSSDASGQTLWASGRTNDLGLIVDSNGVALPSESHQNDPVTGETDLPTALPGCRLPKQSPDLRRTGEEYGRPVHHELSGESRRRERQSLTPGGMVSPGRPRDVPGTRRGHPSLRKRGHGPPTSSTGPDPTRYPTGPLYLLGPRGRSR